MTAQKKKIRGEISQFHRTSITLPVTVAMEVDRRRGRTSFSGQIAADLYAYWRAVGCRLVSLKTKLTIPEIRLLVKSLFGTRWEDRKLDEAVLAEVIEKVRIGGIAYKIGDNVDLNLDELVTRMENTSMIELLALFDLICTSQRQYGKPEKVPVSYFGVSE